MKRETPQPLTASQVFRDVLRIPAPGSRQLVPLVPHPAQRAAIEAFDRRGADGLPVYTELALLWPKRSGKSVTDAGLIITELIGNVTEPDREIVIVASSLAQATDIVFQDVKRFVQRCPWLAKACRILRTEIVFREVVSDGRTGGQHTEEHVVRSVPAGEPGAQHGRDHTLLVVDELHALLSYDVLEALARPANRKAPRIVYSSYAGLKSSAHVGSPLWDLWQRALRGDDSQLFVSLLTGPRCYQGVPWVTAKYLEGQRRQFEAVPQKYARLFLNTWAAGDAGTFLTTSELQDATDASVIEPTRAEPGVTYSLGADLALSHDTAGVVVSHVDPRGKLTIDAVRCYHGTKAKNIDLVAVEHEIRVLARRFRCPIHLDQWQGVLMAQRLNREGFTALVHTIESSRLDSYASVLKSLFTARMITLPAHPDLLEQFENLEGQEMRHDRVRFTSGPGAFDDLPMAVCLSTEAHLKWRAKDGRVSIVQTELGRVQMPEIDSCRAREVLGAWSVPCPLSGSARVLPGCQRCAAYQFVASMRDVHLAKTGQWLDLRIVAGRLRPNAILRDTVFDQACETLW